MTPRRLFPALLWMAALLWACAPQDAAPATSPIKGSSNASIELPLEVLGAEGYTEYLERQLYARVA